MTDGPGDDVSGQGTPERAPDDADVELPAPGRLVERVLARLEGRATGPLVVLDASWPSALREHALDDLAQAASDGRLRGDDLVLFTSGSSGTPRAVVRTAASWRASLQPLSDLTGIGTGQVSGPVWAPGPLTSSLFLYGAVHAAWAGLGWACGRPDAAAVQDVDAAHVVPTQLADALDARERGLLPRLRTVVVAGAHLPTSLWSRARRQGLRVVEYYGAAELSFVGWRDEPGPFDAFPGAATRVHGDGTLWVRSPYVGRDYLDAGAGGPWRQHDGWHTVADLASRDGDGWWLVGRGRAAVTTGGHTVVVSEVEAVLRDVPGATDVVVLGLDHDRLGQVVVAVVRPAGTDLSLRHRMEQVARSLPAPSRPRRWLRADALPLLPSGKVDRAALGALAATLPPLP
ncbi:MAG TPA: AMP-binding protein [Actinomycetales bacterium]|nr:AMP-binding protein [Actinomycetales bacterium]